MAKVVLDVDLEFACLSWDKVEPEVWIRAEGNVALYGHDRVPIEGHSDVRHILGRLRHSTDLVHLHPGDVGVTDEKLDGVR